MCPLAKKSPNMHNGGYVNGSRSRDLVLTTQKVIIQCPLMNYYQFTIWEKLYMFELVRISVSTKQ